MTLTIRKVSCIQTKTGTHFNIEITNHPPIKIFYQSNQFTIYTVASIYVLFYDGMQQPAEFVTAADQFSGFASIEHLSN